MCVCNKHMSELLFPMGIWHLEPAGLHRQPCALDQQGLWLAPGASTQLERTGHLGLGTRQGMESGPLSGLPCLL